MIRSAEALVGVAALALLAVMAAADWYAPPASSVPVAGATAWEAFGVLDLVLAAVAVLGLALVALTAVVRSSAPPVAAALVLVPAAALAGLALLYRLIDPPGGLAVSTGAWLGLACALALLGGAWLSLRDERPPRRAPGPIDVPVRPAPRA